MEKFCHLNQRYGTITNPVIPFQMKMYCISNGYYFKAATGRIYVYILFPKTTHAFNTLYILCLECISYYFRLKLSVSRHMMYRTVSTTVASNSMAPGSIVGSESAIVDIVTQLGATFTKLIELMLSKEIKVNAP